MPALWQAIQDPSRSTASFEVNRTATRDGATAGSWTRFSRRLGSERQGNHLFPFRSTNGKVSSPNASSRSQRAYSDCSAASTGVARARLGRSDEVAAAVAPGGSGSDGGLAGVL